MCQYSKKLHCTPCRNRKDVHEGPLKWVQSYRKDRTYPAICIMRRYTESEKWLIRKRSTDFSLSHDDVLLYVAGKNEDAIAVVLTEDRTNAF